MLPIIIVIVILVLEFILFEGEEFAELFLKKKKNE